jgi:hypothetical protein
MRNVSDKIVEKIKTYILYSLTLFRPLKRDIPSVSQSRWIIQYTVSSQNTTTFYYCTILYNKLHNYMFRPVIMPSSGCTTWWWPNNRPKHVLVKLIVQDSAIIKSFYILTTDCIVYYPFCSDLLINSVLSLFLGNMHHINMLLSISWIMVVCILWNVTIYSCEEQFTNIALRRLF